MTTPQERLEELMTRQEDLHPDLAPYLDTSGPLGPCLRHPMVFSIVHPPQMNAFVNERYRHQKEVIRRAKLEGRWNTYVFSFERPYRINAFMDISWHLEGPDYWDLFGQVWSDTENAWQDRELWAECLTADPEGREMMSSEDVRCVFELSPEKGGLLPETQIYRGYCHEDGLEGFSWTLDRARARWFANRRRQDDDPPGVIAAGKVAREHVIAYITSRDEQEIVCLPEHVTDITLEEA